MLACSSSWSRRKPLRPRVRRSTPCWPRSTKQACQRAHSRPATWRPRPVPCPRPGGDKGAEAAMAGIDARTRVLDVGSGIGGPSRHLAESIGCQVVGDRSHRRILPRGRGADGANRPRRQGDLPAPRTPQPPIRGWQLRCCLDPACRYEHRWTGRASTPRCTACRSPGGRPALGDAIAIDGKEPIYPVPWARDPSTSFLLECRGHARGAGEERLDSSAPGATSRRTRSNGSRSRGRRPRPPKLGLHLLLGPDFRIMAGNFGRNVTEGRVGLLMAVAEKT